MADPWAQFPDAPQQPQGDPWAQFPDAQPEQAAQAAQPPEQPQQPMSPYETALAGLRMSFPIASRLAEPAVAFGTGAVATPVAGLAGAAAIPFKGADAGDVVRNVQSAMTYQPRTREGQALLAAGTAPLQKFADFAMDAGDAPVPVNARAHVASGGGVPLQFRTPGPLEATARNVAIQAAPAALLRRGPKPAEVAVSGRPRTPAPSRPAQPAAKGGQAPAAVPAQRQARLEVVPPTVEELAAQAKAAYKRASEAGVTIAPQSFRNIKNRIGVTLNKEGLDPTLHPSTSAAFKRIAETKGELSLDQLETLRKIASDAKGAPAAADRRLASIVVEHIDDYISLLARKDIVGGKPNAAAALQEARNLWSRKMKAEEIQQLIERAETRAQQFSGSGLENALRTEFRQLAMNQKRMRRFTAEEQAAIRKVARGGPMENTMRFIGKFAPTGVVSGILTGGAGALIGGPLGAALPLTGLAGRAVATRMTKGNAMRAEELMRRGPQKSKGPQTRRTPVREGA